MHRVKQSLTIGLGIAIAGATISCQATVPSRSDVKESEQRPPLLSTQVNSPIAINTARMREDDILPPVSPLDVRGDLLIAGSSSMALLMEVVAERFIEEGFSGALTIERIGSREGFEVFCTEGKADIAIASRAITESERQACATNGRQPMPLAVGTDALAVVAGKGNEFLTDVTQAELTQIFTAEYWSDVRPEWPEELIRRTIPESGSGALQLFVDRIFDGNPEPILRSPNSDFFSEDEDYLVQALAIDPYAIAFFSYTYYEANQDELKLVSIDQSSPGSREEYPLVRTLFLYIDENTLRESSQVSAFINFFLTHVNEEMSPLGYFPLPQEQLDTAKTDLLALLKDDISKDALE